MFNITFVSLNVLSSLSCTPFFTLHDCFQMTPQTSFYNSGFSRSFTSFISSYAMKQNTIIKNTMFSFSLSSAVKFSTEDIFGGKVYNDQRLHFISDSDNSIIITGCIFNHCYSKEQGGSIIILQDCSVTIHNTIFNYSHTASITGGAIFAAKSINDDIENFNNEMIKKLDIQYCCFQHCFGDVPEGKSISPLYGVAVFSSAQENILYYASTFNCPGKDGSQTSGAQFDLQGVNSSSQYINSTGAKSNFCGGIEYRHTSQGFFRYQTISDMECMFAISYTDVETKELDLSYSNIVNVTVKRGQINDPHVHSGLIHVRQTHDITIYKFAFIDNIMKSSNSNVQKIISRGTIKGEQIQMKISLIDCFYSCDQEDVIENTKVDLSFSNCHANANADNLNNISLLDLGECKGDVKASPLTPTAQFTNSNEFTSSNLFSESSAFSDSADFSKSNPFSVSTAFSYSAQFSNSFEFTQSKMFTESDKFTQTKSFIISKTFSASKSLVLLSQNVPLIDRDANSAQEKKTNKAFIAGIASAGGAAAVIASIATILVIKKKNSAINEADIETITESQVSSNNQNPIYNNEASDDPFKEDFE